MNSVLAILIGLMSGAAMSVAVSSVWCVLHLPARIQHLLHAASPRMMGLALLSGVVCVLFGTPVDNSIISGYFAPVWGYVKDSVLMLGVLILVLVCTRKRMYGLGGLALGAAIGAGYALFTMLMASIVDTPIVETPTGLARDFSGLTNAISASVPMLFGNHALWFAPVAGALGLRMSGEKINIRHFADVRVILLILLGFATLMFGMESLSGSVSGLRNDPNFTKFFLMFSNPILGVLAGAILTGIVQSSSASVGILQALSSTGAVSYGAAIPIIMGQNIGTCVTAMLSSVGTNKNARRAAVVHLSFNIIGTVVWLTLFESANAIFRFAFVSTAIDTFHIALIHSIFNLACTLMLLPCCGLLEKLSYKVIPEGQHADATTELDERLFATPAIALVKSEELAKRMAADSELALHESLQAVLGFTPELAASVRQREDDTDRYEDTLGTFLVHLATQPMSEQDSVESSKLLHLIGDFERIADHAVNIIESAEELKEKGVSFTDSAKKELQTMLNAVSEIVDLTSRAFLQDDLTLARQVEPLEQVIDKLKNELRTNHIARLQRGECSLAAGFVLSDLLTNLERVADHCSNIAGCLLDMKNERIDLHKYLGDVKSGSNEFLMQYNTFEEKYKLA